jgi:hypothetical protein
MSCQRQVWEVCIYRSKGTPGSETAPTSALSGQDHNCQPDYSTESARRGR